MNTTNKYPALMRIMHWGVGLLILGIIAIGWYMAWLDKSVSYKYELYHWHKSFGVLVIFLVAARLVIRWCSKFPPPLATVKPVERKFGTLVHWSLYLLMILVPLSGYFMSDAAGKDIPLFNLVMPSFLDKDPQLAGLLHSIHIKIPYVLLGLIALHIAASIKHRYFDKPENDVLKRML